MRIFIKYYATAMMVLFAIGLSGCVSDEKIQKNEVEAQELEQLKKLRAEEEERRKKLLGIDSRNEATIDIQQRKKVITWIKTNSIDSDSKSVVCALSSGVQAMRIGDRQFSADISISKNSLQIATRTSQSKQAEISSIWIDDGLRFTLQRPNEKLPLAITQPEFEKFAELTKGGKLLTLSVLFGDQRSDISFYMGNFESQYSSLDAC